MSIRTLTLTLALAAASAAGASGQDFDADYTGTYSIIALDPATGELGMAVQSKAFAVGNRTVTGKGGLVVLAHQAQSNPMYGALAIQLIQAGLTPQQALDQIVRSDEGRDRRQVAILDVQGRSAAWTGGGASDWKGHSCGKSFCAQGNTLAGPEVVASMARTFEESTGPLADRLMSALDAAQAAGGDSRGMQGASITIFKPLAGAAGWSDRMIDLRVDDHRTPLAELRRLLNLHWSGQLIMEGNQKLSSGDVNGGLALLLAARDKAPGNDNAWIALASAYLKAGQKGEALTAISKALEINPAAKRAMQRNTNLSSLKGDPEFERLVSDGGRHVPALVDPIVRQFLIEEQAAGLAVAVMKGGTILHMKGYGFADLEHRVPATEQTVFKLASLSKQFTAMAVMILMERGSLELDAPLTKYFPEFPATGHVPTIGQLINHTSGLDFQEAWTAIMPPATTGVHEARDARPATLAKLFQKTRFDFAPGERFRYNNNAYDLAGVLIERVSGMSYPDFLQTHIWEPLDMRDTYFMDAGRVIVNRAGGYTLRDEQLAHAPAANLHRLYASGALGTTMADLMKWQRGLHSSRLVSPSTTKLMMTTGRLNDGTPTPYGYGLFLTNMSGKPKIEHYGNIGGTRAQLAYYPSDDLTVAILANTNPLRTDVLESRIARAVMQMPETRLTEVAMPPEQLRRYAGTYLVTDAKISHRSVPTDISFKDGVLYAGRFRLIHTGSHVFVPAGDPYHHYTFTMDAGRPVALTIERETRLIADAHRVSE